MSYFLSFLLIFLEKCISNLLNMVGNVIKFKVFMFKIEYFFLNLIYQRNGLLVCTLTTMWVPIF